MTTTEDPPVTGVGPPAPLEEAEARALATLAGLEYADLRSFPVDRRVAAALASVISEAEARTSSVTAVGWRDGAPVVAIAAPENVLTLDELSRSIGTEIVPIVASASQLAQFLELIYRSRGPEVDAPGGGAPAADAEGVDGRAVEAATVAASVSPATAEAAQIAADGDTSTTSRDDNSVSPNRTTAPPSGGNASPPARPATAPGPDDRPSAEGRTAPLSAPAPETGDAGATPAASQPAGPPPSAPAAQMPLRSDVAGPPTADADIRAQAVPSPQRGAAAVPDRAGVTPPPTAESPAAAVAAQTVPASVAPGAPVRPATTRPMPPPAPAAPTGPTEGMPTLAPNGAAGAPPPPLGRAVPAGTPPTIATAGAGMMPFVAPTMPNAAPAGTPLTAAVSGPGATWPDATRPEPSTAPSTAGPLPPEGAGSRPAARVDPERAVEAVAAASLAGAAGLEYVELGAFAVDATAASVLPEHFARQRKVAALGWLDDVPIVAIGSASDFQLRDDVRAAVGRGVHFVVAALLDIERYNDRLYSKSTPIASNGGAPGVMSTPGASGQPEENGAKALHLPPPTGKPASSERHVVTLESVLVRQEKLTPEQVQRLLDERNRTGRSLREIIADRRLVPEMDLYRAVAEEAGLEFVDLNDWDIDQRAAERVPEALARRHQVLSIGFTDSGEPIVGMANPSDVIALDDIRTLLGREIETVVCPPSQIADYLPRLYRQTREADLMARNAALAAAPETVSRTIHTVVEDGPIVQFVNLILRQALAQRASDVHIEPTVDDVQVRFRIDGVMHPITSTPKTIHSGVLTRLKVMADLDIAEHRVPQDGRISLNFGSREIDLRVATLPTVHGEMVALRILDKASATLELANLGFDPGVLKAYETAFKKPYGTILVTGPTGSGKSTTLYATLNRLNLPDRKLITVEDPVEYQLRGINQVQVNPKAGLGFANALRSILRSDPDVILVGEIRDRETAVIAIEAALTGHLVLSSLHTNDAAGTPMRLVEMGLEAFLVGSALDCVVGQRLARVLCDNCSEEYEPSAEELDAAGWDERDAPDGEPARFRRAVGCQACSRTGYRGRMALHEVMLLSEDIERAVVTHAQSADIQRLAEEQGMRTLRRDGLRKATRGLTSLEEILRVVA